MAVSPMRAPAYRDTRRFLEALYPEPLPGWLIEVRSQAHGADRARQAWAPATDLDAVERLVREAERRAEHVWLGVHPRIRRGGKAEDVGAFVGFFVDVDCKPGRPDRAAVLRRIAELGAVVPPSIVDDSGGGIHAFWALEEPMGLEEAPRYVAIMARLQHALGGDPVADAPRVMRVPGTTNRKPERHGARAHILECHPERRVNPSDLEDWLPALPATSAIPREHRGASPHTHTTKLAPKVDRVLAAVGWRWRGTRQGDFVALLERCPACLADPDAATGAKKWSAHVAPICGALRCKREKCPAGPSRSGADPRSGFAVGIGLAEWVAIYAPEALPSLTPDTRPAWTVPDPAETCASIEEAEERLPKVFAEADAWLKVPGDRPKAAVLVTPPGMGKTREVIRRLATQRGRKRMKGTLLAPSHALLDEIEATAAAQGLTKIKRHYGITHLRPEDGGCVFLDTLKPWGDAGHSIRQGACSTCPHQNEHPITGKPCAAHEGARGDAGSVRLATHAHAASLGPQGELVGPVIVDELQQLLVTRSVDVEKDIGRRLTAAQVRPALRDFLELRRTLAHVIVNAAPALSEEWKRAPQKHPRRVSGTELRESARSDGGAALAEGLRAFAVARNADSVLQRVPTPHGWEMREGRASVDDWPLGDTDLLLSAFAREVTGQSGRGATACLVVSDQGVRLEARWPFPGWTDENDKPVSMMILDASAPAMREAIEAALHGYEVKFFRLAVAEPAAAVRRVWISTAGASRTRLVHDRDFLTHRGGPMFARIARAIGRALPDECASVGFITHRPIARMIRAALAVLDGNDPKGEEAKRIKKAGAEAVLEALRNLRDSRRMGRADVMHYGAARGSNRFEGFDAVVLIGEPWPDLGAAAEDARALGVDPELYAVAIRDAEADQALGRARAVRRTADNPVILVYVGASAPAVWGGLPVDSVVLPQGGPQASESAQAVEDLAHRLVAKLGAAGPGLVRLLAQDPKRFAGLWGAGEQSDITVEQQVSSIYSCVGLLPETLETLDAKTIERAFSRALGDLPRVPTGDPTRTTGGRWVLYESRPGAAGELVERIRAYVAPVTESAGLDVQAVEAPEVLDVPEPIAWPPAAGARRTAEAIFRQAEVDLARVRGSPPAREENAA